MRSILNGATQEHIREAFERRERLIAFLEARRFGASYAALRELPDYEDSPSGLPSGERKLFRDIARLRAGGIVIVLGREPFYPNRLYVHRNHLARVTERNPECASFG